MPKRVQLSRKAGFRLPSGTITVARPTAYGNPFPTRKPGDRDSHQEAVDRFREWLFGPHKGIYRGCAVAVLRGHDLACWCKPDLPCHADVWLEVANSGVPEIGEVG